MSSPMLLSPFTLGDLELPNRVVLAPLTRSRAGVARVPNSLMAEYYVQRSSAGLMISEATTISPQANGWIESPGIYTDTMTEAWASIVKAVHAKKGRIFLQLWHMGRASHSSFHNGQRAVAPSAIAINEEYIHTPTGKQPHEVPRALEKAEIPGIVDDYRNAAFRAKQAGFDGVEIHGANGYLIDQFLQSKSNRRTDEYGGSIENNCRFLKEVVEATLAVWPSNRVGVRLSPNGSFNDMGSPEYRELFLHAVRMLNGFGLGYLHVVDGLAFGFHKLGEPMTLSEFRNVFHGPIIGNCGYTQETGQQAVVTDLADMIAYGRPFISNPDLVDRFRNNWPLAETAPISDWYSPIGAKGYTDFSAYDGAR